MSSSTQQAPPRKSRGRQKVTMAKMENQSNLQVTFSKRRAGLFKKASELCTLCGAEAGIVVFSPAEKVFCFGHPDVKRVLDRFSAGTAPAPANPRSQLIIEAHRNSTIRELNLELTQIESLLRAEKKRAEEVEAVRKAGQMQGWFPTSIEDLSYEELCKLKESVKGFKKNLDAKVQKDVLRLKHSAPSVPTFDSAPRLALGSKDLSPFSNGAVGFGSSGFPAANGQMMTDLPVMANGSTHDDSSSGIFDFGGASNGSSSSRHPTDSMPFGYNIGHHHPILF